MEAGKVAAFLRISFVPLVAPPHPPNETSGGWAHGPIPASHVDILHFCNGFNCTFTFFAPPPLKGRDRGWDQCGIPEW
jgi:hypothetical protein